MLGTLVVTDTVATQLVGNGKYITYRSGGVDGVDSLSWEFQWIAPAAGTGKVIFYGAFNSNFEGHKGGDVTYLTQYSAEENLHSAVSDLTAKKYSMLVYPNPSHELLTVAWELKDASTVQLELTDLSGKRIALISRGRQSGNQSATLDVSEVPAGVYLVSLRVNGNESTRKVTIRH
jgi:hypothetical protein